LAKQYFQYGYWKGRFLKMYPQGARLKHIAPPAFVTAIILFLLGGMLWVPLLIGAAAMLGVYLLAVTAAAGVLTRRSTSAAGVLRHALALVCLHFPWGSGVLIGLLARRLEMRYYPLNPEAQREEPT